MKIGQVVKRYYVEKKTLKYYDNFYKNIKYSEIEKGNILMYVGIGQMYLSPFEILMYHYFKHKGYKVDYYAYNESIPINELITKQIHQTTGKDKFWNEVVRKSRVTLSKSKVEFLEINIPKEVYSIVKELKSLEDILNFRYNEIDFGNIVKGVMYRYYKSLQFDKNAFTIAKQFLVTSLTNYYQIKKLSAQQDYKFVLFSHGIYCTWEPVSKFCEAQNIKYICYDRAKTKSTVNINVNQVAPNWDFSNAWERFFSKKLSEKEVERVEKYLSERELQTGDVYAYNFSQKTSNILSLKSKYNIPIEAKVITIFTNLIWDAANVSRDIAFESTIDCIKKTIDYYKNRTDVFILIRSHPAEKTLGTNEKYGNIIREYFNDALPKNTAIIEPEDNINSFSVIDMTDIGVVNTSTVGLEFAMMNKPIILISETHYRNKGFTYDVSSEEEYFVVINKLVKFSEIKEKQKELSYKYFYIMMFLYQQKIPIKYQNNKLLRYEYKDFMDFIKTDKKTQNLFDRFLTNKEDVIIWE